ncbi:hypothetical protein [Streptomyces sp. JJ36]|uniref:hypothetical protein n=1 Tax=Streptomyces sp. JJ36 TaxID=2736645 RepID=UPI001F182D98|nr:hypothetical protein [Streptomyces sp. JJ36]MCF6524077.1 hypothetical protein [Streptomyces sp. JJ36]
MHRREKDILVHELGEVARASGAGLTRLMAKAMRTNVHEVAIVLPLAADEAHRHVAAILHDEGRVLDGAPEHAPPGSTVLRAVVDAGKGGLNSAVVTIALTPGGDTETHTLVRAAALEGLIKQRAGEHTATRLATALAP